MPNKVKLSKSGKGATIFINKDELEFAGLKPGEDEMWIHAEKGGVIKLVKVE